MRFIGNTNYTLVEDDNEPNEHARRYALAHHVGGFVVISTGTGSKGTALWLEADEAITFANAILEQAKAEKEARS